MSSQPLVFRANSLTSLSSHSYFPVAGTRSVVQRCVASVISTNTCSSRSLATTTPGEIRRPQVYTHGTVAATSPHSTALSHLPPTPATHSGPRLSGPKTRRAFIDRLISDGGDKIVTFRKNILHTEYTRFLTLCDQIKGQPVDSALLQMRWLRKPVTRKMEAAVGEAIVKGKEEGLELGRTYIADAYVKKNGAILQTQLLKKYLRGRGRYGATPHPITTLLEITLQERDTPFKAVQKDPLEWVRERLRQRQVLFAKSAEEVYREVRGRRRIKEVYC
ncbi:uncharacterized protein EV422DRAFT_511621 [Fimicolochytrium jonesii]|uniref:uncharacterized protein n=1 Tax=Fimicolochytrium jonesii TaxID=1396493 RepID=UPI0022FF1DFB|nr:uncharacterized protein EV422DRAFT_511621 [Fimicolochytrium jonesii]KAI8826841.1 hypothetical protein EV422DRAFT_511621 [Fimicolochytrium jonesii]